MTNVKPADIEALIEIFDKSDWDELHIASDGVQLHLAKDAAKVGRRAASTNPPVSAVASHGGTSASQSTNAALSVGAAAKSMAKATGPVAEVIPDGLVAIRAPSLGTFYLAPKPGAPSFVEIGQQVEVATEVCVVEVMKLFTTVTAGMTGTVRRVLVGDGQMVEYDQALFLIEPND